jgi:hypothetical protein
LDTDLASTESAQRNGKEHHVPDRVTSTPATPRNGRAVGSYDLILFFECVHDFGRPVESLAKKIQPTKPTVAPREATKGDDKTSAGKTAPTGAKRKQDRLWAM